MTSSSAGSASGDRRQRLGRRAQRHGAGLQGQQVVVQALDALAQMGEHAGHVALGLLELHAQLVGRLGHARDVLAGLGLGVGAHARDAALGRLHDGADLLAGGRRQRRRGRGRAALERLHLVGEGGEVRVDRGRRRSPGGSSGSRGG